MQSEQTKKFYQEAKINTRSIIQSPRLNVREDKVSLQNGKEKVYHIVTHPGAAAVLPICENGNLLFVKQYRHAIGEITFEIPAGVLEAEEDPLVCARRELREEVGMNAGELLPIIDIFTTPGFTNEKLYLFYGKQLYKDPLLAEDTDEIDIVEVPLKEANEMAKKGLITDAKSLIALLYYDNYLRN